MVSIYRAARSVFPEVMFHSGHHQRGHWIHGSIDKGSFRSGCPAGRAERIRARIVSAKFLRYVYTNDRFGEIARILESGTAPVNTDIRPICYQYTSHDLAFQIRSLASMLRDFSFPELSGRPQSSHALIVLSLPGLLLMRAPWPIRRTILTGIAGFAGMVLETILILHYQTKNGILFQDIGILLTGFMAGLAAGAFACCADEASYLQRIGDCCCLLDSQG